MRIVEKRLDSYYDYDIASIGLAHDIQTWYVYTVTSLLHPIL